MEVRVKADGEHGTKQIWLPHGKLEDFIRSHVPIHTQHQRHIWIGVAPRPRVGDTTPVLHRVLWVDFSASVRTVDDAKVHMLAAGVPAPTMLVHSGNGVHGYWALKEPVSPQDAKPYAKGLHGALPTDATHDSSRIMRVPGTLNVKDPDHPTPCRIAEYRPERVYELTEFPRAEIAEPGATAATPAQMVPLSQEDRELFLANWIDGQKHRMVLAVAGYLRKNLYHDEESALREISRIHREAGYEVDERLIQDVKDTYAKLWATIAGTRLLEELGIRPGVRDVFQFRFVAPPKRRIEIINFREELKDQEFWVPGLLGPGLLTLWSASPKTGKSFAAMQLGYALVSNQPLWDFPLGTGGPKRVLYFQGELSKGMVFSRAKAMFGLAAIRDPERYAMTAKPSEPIDLIKNPEALTDIADAYDVIIIDPISVFTTNDETKSHSVNEIVGTFDQLRSAGKAVFLVHHLRKLQTNTKGQEHTPTFNDIRGSGAWFATADALAVQHKIGQEGNTRVKFLFRAAPDRDPLDLYRLPHGGFTEDKQAYLRTISSMRVRHADSLN